MHLLLAKLISKAIQAMNSRPVQVGGAVAVIGDIVNLNILRQWAYEMAPGSDAAAIEEGARMVMRMLGLEGDEVLWPSKRDGGPITPKYFVLDLTRGRAWFSTKYYSKKSVNAGKRRGSARGWSAGRRDLATVSQAQRG